MDGCHLRHGPGGGDHRRGGVPVAHALVGVHGTHGGRVHHRGASAQGTGGPVPWHQGADITSDQPARAELDSRKAAATATPSWGATPLGGEAELALGGGPARGARHCRGRCNGPACSSRSAEGARHPIGAGGWWRARATCAVHASPSARPGDGVALACGAHQGPNAIGWRL